MTETIKKGDFIELDYTGKLPGGLIFDTTLEKVAKENNLNSEKAKFGPMTIAVGEKQLLPGLDCQLEGKEIGKDYTIALDPEQAFGKRDVKKMRIMPASTFKEHKLQPQPGLQIDVDGEIGTVSRVSGGRIIVNFNHPLAGREVIYDIKINKKVTDTKEQVLFFLNSSLKIPEDKINIKIIEDKAEVKMPFELPAEFTNALGKKLVDLTNLKEVKFVSDVKPAEEKRE